MGEGLYEELAKLEQGHRRGADPGAHLRAGRQPQGTARLSRPPPARERRQLQLRQPHRRRRDSGRRTGPRSRSPSLSKLEPKRNPAIPLPNAIFGKDRRQQRRRRSVSDPLVREPLMKRLKQARRPAAGPRSRPVAARARAGQIDSPYDTPDRGRRRCSRPATPTSIAWSAPAMPRRSSGTSSAARPRARLLDRAADLFEQHREELFSLCIREAGKTVPDAVLEVREAVDFLRYYASEARRLFSDAAAAAWPDWRAERAAPARPRRVRLHLARGIFRWRSSSARSSAPLAAGNAAIAKPAEQTPLIGALAIELMHRRRHPQGDRPACAWRRQGRRRTLTGASADRRRRLHRFDRDGAHDQPQPWPSATGRSSR